MEHPSGSVPPIPAEPQGASKDLGDHDDLVSSPGQLDADADLEVKDASTLPSLLISSDLPIS